MQFEAGTHLSVPCTIHVLKEIYNDKGLRTCQDQKGNYLHPGSTFFFLLTEDPAPM